MGLATFDATAIASEATAVVEELRDIAAVLQESAMTELPSYQSDCEVFPWLQLLYSRPVSTWRLDVSLRRLRTLLNDGDVDVLDATPDMRQAARVLFFIIQDVVDGVDRVGLARIVEYIDYLSLRMSETDAPTEADIESLLGQCARENAQPVPTVDLRKTADNCSGLADRMWNGSRDFRGTERPSAPDPTLNQLDRELLLALSELDATSANKRVRAEDAALRAAGPDADAGKYKAITVKLKKSDLVDTKTGRNGGVWLTATGKEIAEKL